MPNKARSGFTLLETLLAVAILAIAFVSILGSLDNMQRGLGRTQARSQLVELATQKMLEVVEKGPDNIRETKGRFDESDIPDATFAIDITDTIDTTIKRVTVSVDLPDVPDAHITLTRLLLEQ